MGRIKNLLPAQRDPADDMLRVEPDQDFYRTLREAARKAHPQAARATHAPTTPAADDPALARALHAYAHAITDQPGDHEAALSAALEAAKRTRRIDRNAPDADALYTAAAELRTSAAAFRRHARAETDDSAADSAARAICSEMVSRLLTVADWLERESARRYAP